MNDAPATPAAPGAAVPAPAGKPAIPAYLQAMAGQQTSDTDAMASASISIPRVSMKGKKFRFIEGGEEVFSKSDNVDVVILGVEPDAGRFNKTYYIKPYVSGDSSPPDCSSDDGVRPSPWVSAPQHTNCAECPKNRFGSATSRSGKPSKACQDSKRLWVQRAEEAKNPDAVIYAVGATVSSLKNLAEFGREMKQMNVPISAAITQLIMDDDSEFPMFSLKCVGFLEEKDALAAIERGKNRPWRMNMAPALAAPAAAGPGLPQPAAAAGQPAAGTSPVSAAVQAAGADGASAKMDDVVKGW